MNADRGRTDAQALTAVAGLIHARKKSDTPSASAGLVLGGAPAATGGQTLRQSDPDQNFSQRDAGQKETPGIAAGV